MAESRRPRGGRRRSGKRSTFLLLLLTSITVITLAYRGPAQHFVASIQREAITVTSPLQSGAEGFFNPIGNVISGSIHYGDLENQNSELKAEINNLKAQSEAQKNDELRLKEITSLLNLPYAKNLKSVVADVIDVNPSNYELTVELDKGVSSGVEVGMSVVTDKGLVGQVVQVTSNSSTVLLIEDPRSNVAVEVNTSKAVNVVMADATGTGDSKPLSLSFVPPDTKLSRGDLVTTSSLNGSIFPPSIPVGIVTNNFDNSSSLQENVDVAPFSNPDNVNYMAVLLWLPTP